MRNLAFKVSRSELEVVISDMLSVDPIYTHNQHSVVRTLHHTVKRNDNTRVHRL